MLFKKIKYSLLLYNNVLAKATLTAKIFEYVGAKDLF